jgi:hypothetical protein
MNQSMNEDFLSYIWLNQLYQADELFTSSGEPLVVLNPGMPNADAGPDFFDARIKKGSTLWAGNVEIHVRSSDWIRHGHSQNPAFDNVILHVVGHHDVPVHLKDGSLLATLEMKFDNRLLENYRKLMQSEQWIPCQGEIKGIPPAILLSWLDRLAAERLDMKSEAVLQALESTKNDWEETFYRFLARSFGMRLNALPFEMLASSTPLRYLLRHRENIQHLESMLFGQAGFLEKDVDDEYHKELKRDYLFFRSKFSLKPMEGYVWKFLRLRPLNFPTLRIAQLASLISSKQGLFSAILECAHPKQMIELLEVQPSEYWLHHYQFGNPSPGRMKKPGRQLLHSVIINAVVPVLFSYGRVVSGEKHKQLAFELLQEIPPESNSVITRWKENSVFARNAMETQSLLHLKRVYCSARRCLTCSIGNHIMIREVPCPQNP